MVCFRQIINEKGLRVKKYRLFSNPDLHILNLNKIFANQFNGMVL